jgi:hypothetical protein
VSADGSKPLKSRVGAPMEENVKRIEVTPDKLPSPATDVTAVQE